MNPLISVIMPVFNREKYISFAIESVLYQTYKNIELIIVNDGSVDNTCGVIKKYSEDKRVKYFYQSNKGAAAARNTGLKESKGEYICFLDSDNIWDRNKVELQIGILNSRPDIDIVYNEGKTIDINGEILSKKTKVERYSGYISEKLILNNFITNNSVIFKRKCYDELGGFNDNLRCSEDYDLWLRYSTRFKFYYDPKVVYKYRVGPNRLSENYKRVFNTNKAILESFLKNNRNLIPNTTQKLARANLYRKYGYYLKTNLSFYSALSNYTKAIYLKPFNKAAWRLLFKLVIEWIFSFLRKLCKY